MRRLRLAVIGLAAGLAAVVVLLAVLLDESILLLLPVVLAAWFIVYMPLWRRKVRRRARRLPSGACIQSRHAFA